jgi:peptide/nickel transport system substrate-binding protein
LERRGILSDKRLVSRKARSASFRLAIVLLVAAPALGGAAGAPAATGGHYGGTLTVGITLGPATLDPTLLSNGTLEQILPEFCLPLYTYASNHGTLELDPILAAAQPQISADKLTYTIQLRHGIEFNDGTPFNAQAVIASYQRYTTYPGSIRSQDFLGVASATAADPYTVVYHLTRRNATFTGNLYPLSPTATANEGAGFANDPIGVGPFMVQSWTVGDSLTLVKSPYYYKRGAIYLDRIVFKYLPDSQTVQNALLAGDIQVGGAPGPQPTGPNLTVIKATSLGMSGIVINIGNKNGKGNPFTNVGTPLAQSAKLRQAFAEAIDRNTLEKVAWGGTNDPTCTLIPPNDTEWYAQTKVPCTPYDPKDAKKLVAASGYPTPITVHLLIVGSSDVEGQVIQSEEAAVGFNVVIDNLAAVQFVAAFTSGNFDTVIRGISPTDPDPNTYLYQYFATAGPNNISGYSNPRLDYVLANALKATDPKARAVDYRVAQQIILDDLPIIPLRYPVHYAEFDSDLTGIQYDPFGDLLLANAQYKS